MGIDTGCMLIVGLPADELEAGLSDELKQRIKGEGFYEVVSEDGELKLSSASPYFDSSYDERLWGISLASEYWAYKEIDIATLPQKIVEAQAAFKAKTGLEGRLFVSPHVT